MMSHVCFDDLPFKPVHFMQVCLKIGQPEIRWLIIILLKLQFVHTQLSATPKYHYALVKSYKSSILVKESPFMPL